MMILFFLVAARQLSANPEVPGAPQQKPIALVGGTVHPVSSEPIENATLLFEKGKIVAIGTDLQIPGDALQVNVSGRHVYPGLFDAYTKLGLVEINAVRASRDYRESGSINPNVQAHVAVNPDSELIPVARSNGVLLALTAPTGGIISGRSAVLQLDGWTYEDLTLQPNVGLHVRWPAMSPVSDWWVEGSAKEQLESRDRTLRQLEEAFENARNYRKARRHGDQPRDSRWESMISVLDGKLPVIAGADDAQQIQSAIAFARRQNVKLIILGGYDAPHCAELLRADDIPVIISAVFRLPRRRSDDYDAAYTLPERLRQLEIPFCIASSDESNVRNLPYHAATAAAYGLPVREAVRAITLSPAEILGVSDRVGSLQADRDATLIVTDGNPLETTTQVEMAFIRGAQVQLNDRHKRLWKKYQEKYRQ